MRRKKSSLSTYLVIVGLFYGGLYLALDHFAAGPEPEGVADVEWIELGAAPLGQPEAV